MYIRIKEQGLEHVDPKVGVRLCLLLVHKQNPMASDDVAYCSLLNEHASACSALLIRKCGSSQGICSVYTLHIQGLGISSAGLFIGVTGSLLDCSAAPQYQASAAHFRVAPAKQQGALHVCCAQLSSCSRQIQAIIFPSRTYMGITH